MSQNSGYWLVRQIDENKLLIELTVSFDLKTFDTPLRHTDSVAELVH